MAAGTATDEAILDAAPDWNLIHFDVRCARCGEDLRGQEDPQCAACGLDFKWSDAAPAQHLTCPSCDYRVYGLSATRCPECGGEFDWDEALQRHRTKNQPWFEYRWFDRPVGSFVTTCWRSLRPSRFWRDMDLHDPPQRGPLHALALVVICICCATVLVGDTLAVYGWSININRQRFLGGFGRPGAPPSLLVFFQQFGLSRASLTSVLDAALVLLLWSYCGRLAMSVFQQSMARAKVRNAQLARVWAYSWSSPMLATVAVTYGIAAADVIRGSTFLAYTSGWGALAGILLVTWSVSRAYRHYLRIPHSLAVALSIQAMALLGAAAVLVVVKPPLLRRVVGFLGI